MTPRGASGGFTLLELLVAMTLLALVLAVAAGGLRFGAAAWQTGAARLDQSTALQSVHALVQRQLGAARPLRPFAGERAPLVAFTGESDSLRFIGPAPAQAMRDGLYEYLLALRPGHEGGAALVLAWRPFVAGEGGFGEPIEGHAREILSGVEALAISYYGESEGGGEALWQDSWRLRAELPRLVRIAIAHHAGDRRAWPPLVVAPRLWAP